MNWTMLAPIPWLFLAVWLLAGCAVGSDWTIPECRGDGKTPCVGPCLLKVDTQTVAEVPLAVRIKEANGMERCEEIKQL